jgi:hypothetical protein
MSRYFFSTANGEREIDKDRMELADPAAARIAAIRHAGAIMENEPEVLWDGCDFRVELTDDCGLLLFTIVTLVVNAPAAGKAK